jgi:scyllo-inositol 2-dehydrogenase (NADP+)
VIKNEYWDTLQSLVSSLTNNLHVMHTINTALLSFGMSGKVFHAPFLTVHPGFRLTGAWERSIPRIVTDYPQVKSYPTLESLLMDDAVELVVVNTPINTHYEFAREALLAGKNVIVEKAFTTTVAEARELAQLARERNRLLSVFQNRRWDSDFKTVQQVIHSGLLGDIVEATICFDRYSAGLSQKAHKEVPGLGSGNVYDLGPHLIDQALVLFGMPEAVFADFMVTRAASQVEDYFEIRLYYPQHRVRLKSGYFVREPAPAYQVHGKKGSFLKTRADVQEASLLKGMLPDASGYGIEPDSEMGLLHTEKNGLVVREHIPTLPGNYLAYYENIYHAITGKGPAPVAAEEGISVMQIIEAAYESHSQRQAVALR